MKSESNDVKSESGKCDLKDPHAGQAEAFVVKGRTYVEPEVTEAEDLGKRKECDQQSCSKIGNQRCAGCCRALYCGQVQKLQFYWQFFFRQFNIKTIST